MALVIRRGEIITADSRYVADIYCENEQITTIGPNLSVPADVDEIDAEGCHVFPGFIDPHVHIHLPFMGTYARDNWQTASRAALVGGTTTLIEMICPAKTDAPREAFELWSEKAAGQAACDYSFHMGVTRFDREAEPQLREIVAQGIRSFKVFLAYKDALGVDDRELFQTLQLSTRIGCDCHGTLRK